MEKIKEYGKISFMLERIFGLPGYLIYKLKWKIKSVFGKKRIIKAKYTTKNTWFGGTPCHHCGKNVFLSSDRWQQKEQWFCSDPPEILLYAYCNDDCWNKSGGDK
jgi:hypothetical protein